MLKMYRIKNTHSSSRFMLPDNSSAGNFQRLLASFFLSKRSFNDACDVQRIFNQQMRCEGSLKIRTHIVRWLCCFYDCLLTFLPCAPLSFVEILFCFIFYKCYLWCWQHCRKSGFSFFLPFFLILLYYSFSSFHFDSFALVSNM